MLQGQHSAILSTFITLPFVFKIFFCLFLSGCLRFYCIHGFWIFFQVMCSICLSRQGMSETELKEMFDIPDHVWSPLYFAIEHVIVDQSGLLK